MRVIVEKPNSTVPVLHDLTHLAARYTMLGSAGGVELAVREMPVRCRRSSTEFSSLSINSTANHSTVCQSRHRKAVFVPELNGRRCAANRRDNRWRDDLWRENLNRRDGRLERGQVVFFRSLFFLSFYLFIPFFSPTSSVAVCGQRNDNQTHVFSAAAFPSIEYWPPARQQGRIASHQ